MKNVKKNKKNVKTLIILCSDLKLISLPSLILRLSHSLVFNIRDSLLISPAPVPQMIPYEMQISLQINHQCMCVQKGECALEGSCLDQTNVTTVLVLGCKLTIDRSGYETIGAMQRSYDR